MQSQRWQDKQISIGDLVRLSSIIVVVLLLVGLGVIYVLSVLFSPNPSVGWPAIFSATFVVLNVLFVFIQIVIAFRTASPTLTPSVPIPTPDSSFDKDKGALALFRLEVENELQGEPNKGAIIIVTVKQMLNKEIIMKILATKTIESSAPVVTRNYNEHAIYVARALLAPGFYEANCPTASRLPIRSIETVDVAKGQISELDWRRM